MCPHGLRAATGLAAALGVLLAGAAPPPTPVAAPGASAPAAGAEDPEGCSAEERRERLAKEAARRDLDTLALMATKWAIDHAEKVADGHWDRVGVDFLKASRVRGDRYLHAIARKGSRVRAIPRSTCRALAARDASSCQALFDPQDRASCASWLALEAALRPDGPGCDKLPPPLAGACRHLSVVGHSCADEPSGPHREGCDQLAGAAAAIDTVCSTDFEPTRCGWGLLVAGLGTGGSACAAVAPGPGRRTRQHAHTHALCRAVIASEPARCPADDADPARPDQVHSFAEAAAIGAVSGAQIVASVQVDTPAICALRFGVHTVGHDTPAVVSEIVRPNSWSPLVWWRDLDAGARAETLRVDVSAVCAPRVAWMPQPAVPLSGQAP